MYDDPVVDRRAREQRRIEYRYQRFRDIAATLIAFCGGLVVMFLFFAAIGAVNLGDAIGFTIAAIALTAVWLLGVWQRVRSGSAFVTRPDRERRGF
jgi:hypothetical protein